MRYICFSFLFLLLTTELAIADGPFNVGAGSVGGVSGVDTSKIPRPIVIAGNVRTSSGETPAEPVSIKRECGMDEFTEAYTDSEGRFSFVVGGNQRYAIMDAAADGGAPGLPQGNLSVFNTQSSQIGLGVDLSHCLLTAELPGYSSSSIQLTRRRSMDRPNVGTLILTPLGGSTGALVSATTLTAPKAARKALEKAIEEMNKGSQAKLPRAIGLLEKAVEEHPSYAAAWAVLGEARERMGDQEGALNAFERALEADPSYPRAYLPMTLISVRRGDWGRAVELTAQGLELDPANVLLHWFNAVGQFELGRLEEALTALDQLESELGAQRFPQTHHIRGLIYAQPGEFIKAAAQLRTFLEEAPDSPAAEEANKQLAEWKELGVLSPVAPQVAVGKLVSAR